MGVYVFQSKHAPYIKIGHYAKSNAWSRIAHRGFGKILHPAILKERVTVHDLDLVAWYPELKTKDEKRLHKLCLAHHAIGEWFSLDALPSVLAALGPCNQAHMCSKEDALNTRRRL